LDNENGKTIKQALEEERRFFANHNAYKDIADTQGTEMLAKKLSLLLVNHIKKLLPDIEKLINKNYEEYSKILEGLGSCIKCENEYDAYEFVTKAIDEYSIAYKDLIDGKSGLALDTTYLGGSKIYQIFKCFGEQKICKIDPLKELTIEHILVEMRKAYGMNPGLFVPEEACRNLIVRKISDFKKPSNKCSRLVYQVLDQAVTKVMDVGLEPRQKLRAFIQETMEKLLEDNYQNLLGFIKQRIEAEKSYINYDDDDFMLLKPYIITDDDPDEETLNYLEKNFNLNKDLFNKEVVDEEINEAIDHAKRYPKDKKSSNKHSEDDSSEEENLETWDVKDSVDISNGISPDDFKNIMSMKRVIHSYFELLKKEFKTNVPKYIVEFLVRSTVSKMRTALQMALMRHKEPMSLVYEDESTRSKREISQKCIIQLKVAIRAIKSMKRGQGLIDTSAT